MEHLLGFVQDNLIWILTIIAIIIIVLTVLKTIVKWLITAVLVLGIMYFYMTYQDPINTIGSNLAGEAVSQIKTEISDKIVLGEGVNYATNADGTYRIKVGNITIEGKEGESRTTISFDGAEVEVDVDEELEQFLEELKNMDKKE